MGHEHLTFRTLIGEISHFSPFQMACKIINTKRGNEGVATDVTPFPCQHGCV